MANEATIELSLKEKQLQDKLGQIEKTLHGFGDKISSTFTMVGGAIAGAFTISAGIGFLKDITSAAMESEFSWAKLTAAVNAAGKSTDTIVPRIQKLSVELQRTTGVSDELTAETAAMLQRFQNLDEDGIERVIRAANDMSMLLGGDLRSSSEMLARALEDPERGMMMLRRSGVILSDATKQQIKDFMELGKTAEAQNLILSEVEKRFGGIAQELGNTTTIQFKALNERFGDIKETLGTAFLPAMQALADVGNDVALSIESWLGAMGPDAVEGVSGLQSKIIALGVVLRNLGDSFTLAGTAAVEFLGLGLGGHENPMIKATEESLRTNDEVIRRLINKIATEKDPEKKAEWERQYEAQHAFREQLQGRLKSLPKTQGSATEALADKLAKEYDDAMKRLEDRLNKQREKKPPLTGGIVPVDEMEELRKQQDERIRKWREKNDMSRAFEQRYEDVPVSKPTQSQAFTASFESLDALSKRISAAAASEKKPEDKIVKAVQDAGQKQLEKLDQLRRAMEPVPKKLDEQSKIQQDILDKTDPFAALA